MILDGHPFVPSQGGGGTTLSGAGAEGILRQITASTFENLKTNLTAVTDPGVGDDDLDDYLVGSIWLNTDSPEYWICRSNSTGAAAWESLTRLRGGFAIPDAPGDGDYQFLGDVDVVGDLSAGTVASDGAVSGTDFNPTGHVNLAAGQALDLRNDGGEMIRSDGDGEINFYTAESEVMSIDAAGDLVVTGKATADGFKGTTTAMSDGATVTIDMDDGDYHTVTLGGDRTIDASNLEAGRCLNIKFKQDGTGTRVAAFAAKFKFPGGADFVLSVGANDEDVLTFVTFDASSLYAVGQPDFS